MNSRTKRTLRTIEDSLKKGEWLTVMRIGCLWLVVKNNEEGANYFILVSRNASYAYSNWQAFKHLKDCIYDYRDHTFDSSLFTEIPDDTSETKVRRSFGDTYPNALTGLKQCPFQDPEPPQLAPTHQWAQEPQAQ